MKKVLLLPIILLSLQSSAQRKVLNLIVGTYTKPGGSEGIYVYEFNTESADFKLKQVNKGIDNPSYLALSADNRYLYSVNESGKNSAVSAFNFEAATGKLNLLNRKSTGADPCFVIADKTHVISANYSGGNASVFGIKADGSLTDQQQLLQHTGSSVNKERQNEPHVHMAQFTPDKKFVVLNDLGTDKVHLYNYNRDAEKEVLTEKTSVSVEPGAGPRILTFSKDGKYAYLIDEMFAGVTVFSYHNGSLEKLQYTKITEEGFNGKNGAAHIMLSPDGKFLYASNRGSENKITIFAIEKGGLLSKRDIVSTGGKGPRNFVIDPTGKFLLVGHQYTNDIAIFERNSQTGMLKDTGKKIPITAPVCLVFTTAK